MSRLAVLLLPALASCTYASAKAEEWESSGNDGVGISTRTLDPSAFGDSMQRSMGARIPSLTSDLFAPVAHEEGELKTYDLRAQTFHTPQKYDPVTGNFITTQSAKATSAPPPEAPPERGPQQQERQVIYTGSLALQVPDPEGLELEVATIAKGYGGWVSKIERPRVTLRVPAARFEEAMKALSALGQVLDRKISGQDVSDQYRDLRIRLENAEKVRVRLAALLEQAKNVQDALAVEKELGRVTEEIERYKGQLAAMQDQVAFSSITLELRRSLPLHARTRRFPFPWVHRLGAESLLRF